MSDNDNSKRIAKNTLLLYFRMLITMGVSLYTSRIVLNTLGVEDFGIYSVVGGVVLMFSFLNSSMSSATQRFLSYELGKNNTDRLKKVFCMSVNIHAIIAVTIFVLAETIGLWFLNTKLVIPYNRMEAANWVYQFTILSFMLAVMNVPYNASIIAHERMNIYAYISIVDVVLKLMLIFTLVWLGFDKLKMYAVLVFIVSAIVWILYKNYSTRHFQETKYSFYWERNLYKTLINYAGWNLFGNIAGVAFNQGINILLNIFFGPVINAARAIAYQVNGAVSGFVSNFQMAMNPQIVKSYATNNKTYMQQLIFQGSKYSFFLLFFLSLPVLLNTETILLWWLKTVPEYTVLFCQLVLTDALINTISGPLMTAAQATGKIKKYQAIVGGILLLNVPFSYLFLRMGYQPQVTILVSICLSLIALCARLAILKTLMAFSSTEFLKQVIFRILLVFSIAFTIPFLAMKFIEKGEFTFAISGFLSFISVVSVIYVFGLKIKERKVVNDKLIQALKKLQK